MWELLDFNVFNLNSNRIQHQPRSAATWDIPPYRTPLPSCTLHPELAATNFPTLPCSWPVAVLVVASAAE